MSRQCHFALAPQLVLMLALLASVFAKSLRSSKGDPRVLYALVASSSSSGIATEVGTNTQEAHEGPSIASFTGPLLAGMLAIVLIGAVVAFKHRKLAVH